MVSGQSAASGTASGARPALGLAAPSPDRNWILPDGAALVHLSGIRNPGIVASAVRQTRVFSKRILAISDLARAGSNPGSMGIRCHDGHADPSEDARLYRHAHS